MHHLSIILNSDYLKEDVIKTALYVTFTSGFSVNSFPAIDVLFHLSVFSLVYGRRRYYTSSSGSKHGKEEAETSDRVCKQMHM